MLRLRLEVELKGKEAKETRRAMKTRAGREGEVAVVDASGADSVREEGALQTAMSPGPRFPVL